MRNLPSDELVLRELFSLCVKCIESANRDQTLDYKRGELLARYLAGKYTYEDFKGRTAQLIEAGEQHGNEGDPPEHLLYPYLDMEAIEEARRVFEQGIVEADKGYDDFDSSRDLACLHRVCHGFETAVRGHQLRITALTSLVERFKDAIDEGRPTVGPSWDRSSGRLSVGGSVVRKIRSPKLAENICAILDRFEAAGWETSVAVPDGWPQKTIHETVRSLNDSQTTIKFSGNVEPPVISWSFNPSSSR